MNANNWYYKLNKKAEKLLSQSTYDFVAGGADDESTIINNLRAFERYSLIPRTFVHVSTASTAISILDEVFNFPFLIAPSAPHKLLHEKGDHATAKAAEKTNTTMIVSFMASIRLEEIAQQCSTNLWFQMQILKSMAATVNLIKRAESSGYKALVITIDMPIVGTRYRDIKNNFEIPENCLSVNLIDEGIISPRRSLASLKTQSPNSIFDPNVSWQSIEYLKTVTKLPIFLKGILHPDDAQKAIEIGIDGIIVSNHGGRQLGSTIATLDALPNIVSATENQIPILVDGGIRSGVDIIKALALGAKAVLIGRPILWGLAIGGAQGVSGVINFFQRNCIQTMKLCGIKNIVDIQKQNIIHKQN